MFKLELEKNTKTVIYGSTFFLTVIFAIILYIAENPYYVAFDQADPFDGTVSSMIWLVFITGTTVGYGGLVPHTSLGKIIIIFVIVVGTFMMSIIIAEMARAVEMSEGEKKASVQI